MTLSRRTILGAAGAATLLGRHVFAAASKLRIGLLLPYSGTYAALGNNITDAMKLAAQEHGGKLGGREIEYFKVDDESDPAKAPDNVNKLIARDKVDVLIGTVHSGRGDGDVQIVRQEKTLLIVPNAGAEAITGPLCAPNIVRSSFSNWQTVVRVGATCAARRAHKKAMTMFWNYGFGAGVDGGVQGGLREGRRHHREGARAAVPERRVPGAPDRDRVARSPTRCSSSSPAAARSSSSRTTPRRGCNKNDPALRPRLPHRRHARGAGRRGRGHADHAALRRRPRHAAQQELPRGVRDGHRPRRRRLRGAGLRRGATCWRRRSTR